MTSFQRTKVEEGREKLRAGGGGRREESRTERGNRKTGRQKEENQRMQQKTRSPRLLNHLDSHFRSKGRRTDMRCAGQAEAKAGQLLCFLCLWLACRGETPETAARNTRPERKESEYLPRRPEDIQKEEEARITGVLSSLSLDCSSVASQLHSFSLCLILASLVLQPLLSFHTLFSSPPILSS